MAWRDDSEARPEKKKQTLRNRWRIALPEEFPPIIPISQKDQITMAGQQLPKTKNETNQNKQKQEIKTRLGKRAPKGKPMSPKTLNAMARMAEQKDLGQNSRLQKRQSNIVSRNCHKDSRASKS